MERVRPKFPTSFLDEHNAKRFEMDCQGTKTRLYIVVVICLQLIAPGPKAWTFIKEHKYLRSPSFVRSIPSHPLPLLSLSPPSSLPFTYKHPPTVPPSPIPHRSSPPPRGGTGDECFDSRPYSSKDRLSSLAGLAIVLNEDASFVKKQELLVEPVAGER